ncbi:MAG: hypothetical protein AAB444_01340 [Patescibacteria group bacterium]
MDAKSIQLAEGQIWRAPASDKPCTTQRPRIKILGFTGELVQWRAQGNPIHHAVKKERLMEILAEGGYILEIREPVFPTPDSSR